MVSHTNLNFWNLHWSLWSFSSQIFLAQVSKKHSKEWPISSLNARNGGLSQWWVSGREKTWRVFWIYPIMQMKRPHETIVAWSTVLASFMTVGTPSTFSKRNATWLPILMEKKSSLSNNIKRSLNKARFSNVKCVSLGFSEVITEIRAWSIPPKSDQWPSDNSSSFPCSASKGLWRGIRWRCLCLFQWSPL